MSYLSGISTCTSSNAFYHAEVIFTNASLEGPRGEEYFWGRGVIINFVDCGGWFQGNPPK
jgi:hypothetical protein